MAMCPRENDASAISRKFAGITRVFHLLVLPLLPSPFFSSPLERTRARARDRLSAKARDRGSERRGTRVCSHPARATREVHRLSIL